MDPSKVGTVEDVTLQRDVATLTLNWGQICLSRPLQAAGSHERVVGAVFEGSGNLRLSPTLGMERQQLAFHSKEPVLQAEFERAFFIFTDDTAQELQGQLRFGEGNSAQLEKHYREWIKKLQRYGRDWTPRLLKGLLAEDPTRHAFFVAELKTRKHDRLTLIFDSADPEEVELVHLGSDRHVGDVWAKFPSGGRTPDEAFADPLGHHDYLVKSYVLDMTVEKSTELSGQAKVELEMKSEGERVVLLSLDPTLRVSEVTNSDGHPLNFFQPRDPKDDFFLGDYLAVVSPSPFPRGAVTLGFKYSGKRIIEKVGPGNFFCQSFGWYPSYGLGRVSLNDNTFAARVDFDITLRVPERFDAVVVGTKVEDRKDKRYRITRWKSDIPLAVAGFAYGDYKIHKEKVGNIEVEVYANKEPGGQLRGITLAEFLPGPGAPGRGRTLGSLSPSRLAETMAVEVANNLRLMERYFGPYPYSKLAVTNIPYSYGQGWPSLLYISSLSFLDSTQRHQLGIRDHVRITDFFRAHETSHQWWGHVVGWKSYHDQWLSEGFAEFSGILYTQFRKNPDESFRLLRRNRESLLTKDRYGAVHDQIGPIYAGLRLSSRRHPSGYSVVVYKKGGWVLHMLRMMLYEPRDKESDQRFIAMMHDFTKRYQNQPASTEDFKQVVEKYMLPSMNMDSNGTMDWFFDSWVYGTGIPHYEFRYEIKPAAEGKWEVSGALQQTRVPENFRMIVPVFVHRGDGLQRLGWVNATSRETPFQVILPFKPDKVTIKVTISEWEDILATIDYK